MTPVVSVVWSCNAQTALRYPAVFLFRFLAHHGMLSVSGAPVWWTVTGGSRSLYIVTLGGQDRFDPARLLARMTYEHPAYTTEPVAAQRRLPELNTRVTVFAGAYQGWGFHEDGCRSGVEAAALRVRW